MEPEEIVKLFIEEMKEIELDAFEKHKLIICDNQYTEDPEPFFESFNKKVRQVYFKYCTSRNIDKACLRSFGNPPDYDPKTQSIIEKVKLSSNRIRLATSSRFEFQKYNYLLIKRHGQWRIDSRVSVFSDGKTIKGLL